MRTICSREIFTKKCRQQQNFDSDPKEAWHYNHVTFTPIAKNFMLYCRLIYMLSMLYVRHTIKVKVGIPESFTVWWYSQKITGSSHLKFHSDWGQVIGKIKHDDLHCCDSAPLTLCLLINYATYAHEEDEIWKQQFPRVLSHDLYNLGKQSIQAKEVYWIQMDREDGARGSQTIPCPLSSLARPCQDGRL